MFRVTLSNGTQHAGDHRGEDAEVPHSHPCRRPGHGGGYRHMISAVVASLSATRPDHREAGRCMPKKPNYDFQKRRKSWRASRRRKRSAPGSAMISSFPTRVRSRRPRRSRSRQGVARPTRPRRQSRRRGVVDTAEPVGSSASTCSLSSARQWSARPWMSYSTPPSSRHRHALDETSTGRSVHSRSTVALSRGNAATAARDGAAPQDDVQLTEIRSRRGTRKPRHAQCGGRGLQHAP
jgi:hypothetical protein